MHQNEQKEGGSIFYSLFQVFLLKFKELGDEIDSAKISEKDKEIERL
jgi:hypothetical protein